MAKRADAPARDPVIEAFKKDVDRTLLRENLRLTPERRILKLQAAVRSIVALREARKSPK
jgi:hypothetical protein